MQVQPPAYPLRDIISTAVQHSQVILVATWRRLIMDQQAMKEFVVEYVSELKDLTFNSKSLINTLTMLAGDSLELASSIAAAIEKHILTCAPAHKLYALYLVDSIVKNIGVPYTTLFAGNMPEVFRNVWLAAPQAQGSLRKVLNTWKGIFPEAMLAAVARHIGSPAVVPQQVPYTAAAMPAQMASASLAGPAAAYPGKPALVPLVPFQGTSGAGQGMLGAQSNNPPQSLSQYGSPYAQSTLASSATVPLTGPQQPNSYRSGNQAQSKMHVAGLRSSKPTQDASTAGTNPLSSLPDISAEELPLKYVDREKLELSTERLKAEDPQALRELLACSRALRPKHVDRRFLHRRRMRGKGIMSQQWFVGADSWIAGTAADVQAAPAFFDIESKASAEQQEVSVPADDAQPACALSGERFDTFWDDAREDWRYRDAVALTAEQAARYGVPAGTIVKVSCLSNTPASAAAAEEAPAESETEALEQTPSIKQEPGISQLGAANVESQGVKREAEEAIDAHAAVKRIKAEPV